MTILVCQKKDKNLNDSHTLIWKTSTFLNQIYSLYPSNFACKKMVLMDQKPYNSTPTRHMFTIFLQEKKFY